MGGGRGILPILVLKSCITTLFCCRPGSVRLHGRKIAGRPAGADSASPRPAVLRSPARGIVRESDQLRNAAISKIERYKGLSLIRFQIGELIRARAPAGRLGLLSVFRFGNEDGGTAKGFQLGEPFQNGTVGKPAPEGPLPPGTGGRGEGRQAAKRQGLQQRVLRLEFLPGFHQVSRDRLRVPPCRVELDPWRILCVLAGRGHCDVYAAGREDLSPVTVERVLRKQGTKITTISPERECSLKSTG